MLRLDFEMFFFSFDVASSTVYIQKESPLLCENVISGWPFLPVYTADADPTPLDVFDLVPHVSLSQGSVLLTTIPPSIYLFPGLFF